MGLVMIMAFIMSMVFAVPVIITMTMSVIITMTVPVVVTVTITVMTVMHLRFGVNNTSQVSNGWFVVEFPQHQVGSFVIERFGYKAGLVFFVAEVYRF